MISVEAVTLAGVVEDCLTPKIYWNHRSLKAPQTVCQAEKLAAPSWLERKKKSWFSARALRSTLKGEKHDFILIPPQTRTPSPLILDQNYINTKNQVIKAERRVLKELGFCVHVKHPHKVSGSHLQPAHVTHACGLNTAVPSVCRSSSCTSRCWSVRRTRSWCRRPGESPSRVCA